MLIVIDTETTDLSPQTGGLIELAAVKLRGTEIVDRWSALVWPGHEFLKARNREVMVKTSGITVEELIDEGMWPSDVRFAFSDFIALGTGTKVTSFNTDFDRKFVDLPGLPWAPCIMKTAQNDMALAVPCPLRRRAAFKGIWKSPSLGEACAHYGVPFEETHRALGDAVAAAQIAAQLGMDVY